MEKAYHTLEDVFEEFSVRLIFLLLSLQDVKATKLQISNLHYHNYSQLHYSSRRFDFSGAEQQEMTNNVLDFQEISEKIQNI